MSGSTTVALADPPTLVRAVNPGGPQLDVLLRARPLRFPLEASLHAAAADVVPREDWPSEGEWPRECAVIVPPFLRGASKRRLSTFLAGRHCAGEALREGGIAHSDHVGMRGDGAPIWPRGIVGSIAHTDRCAVSAVAAATDVRGLGIDLEHLLTAAEADQMAADVVPELSALAAAGDGDLPWAARVTIAFSVKESVYKCLAPLTGVFLTFGDVQIVHIDLRVGRVEIRLGRHIDAEFAAGTLLSGRFVTDGDVVMTMVQLDR